MRDNSFPIVILIPALLYTISPIDLIPDVIPVVGWAAGLAVGAFSEEILTEFHVTWAQYMCPSITRGPECGLAQVLKSTKSGRSVAADQYDSSFRSLGDSPCTT